MQVPRFGRLEHAFEHAGQYANPYTAIRAGVDLVSPSGARRRIPLCWDGGTTWRLRFSPHP